MFDPHAKTMFDDGRFLKSVVAEAASTGLKPSGSRCSVASSSDEVAVPPLLQAMSTRGIEKEPHESPLAETWEGGGGVRIFPPTLDESLEAFSDCFSRDSRESKGNVPSTEWLVSTEPAGNVKRVRSTPLPPQ